MNRHNEAERRGTCPVPFRFAAHDSGGEWSILYTIRAAVLCAPGFMPANLTRKMNQLSQKEEREGPPKEKERSFERKMQDMKGKNSYRHEIYDKDCCEFPCFSGGSGVSSKVE